MKCADRVWIVLGFLFCSLGSAGGSLRLAEDNIDEIVKQMSLREKAMLLVGCESLVSKDSLTVYVPGAAGYTKSFPQYGIPSTVMADGPVGVRIFPIKVDGKRHYCTCFPSSTLLASTWDTQLVETQAGAMGKEAAVYDVDVILTPGINIMRNPLCGRNFEYFSEDPVLSGLMGAAMVNGVQSRGIGTSLKHFVANNQQVNKLNNDSRIPVKALREIYLKGFEICLQHSNPWTVMSSYNKIGGILTQSNAELLRTVLREEWGYDGLVVSDWYGKRNSPEQLEGGTNLLMPGEKAQLEEIEAGIKSGALSMEVIDDAVKHILDYVVKTKAFRRDIHAALPDLEQHAALSRSVAGQGMVLLKNDSCVLPLKGIKNISLFEITDFPNHPFKVRMDAKMVETIESVREHGVLVPALVREKPTGGYEMISGHRRKMASELAGLENIPCIVRNLSDDEAVIVMVDSNLQREEILPSEKAFAYKMKLDVMKRQGQRTDLTSSPLATKLKGKRSDELLGEEVGESKDQIRRYIRLTYLIPEILDMVDNKKIAMRPAVELSYLPKEEQEILYDTMESEDCTPSHAQAIKIRKFSAEGRLNEDVLLSIMAEEKPNQVEQWKIPKNRLKKYFPSGTTQQKMEETIIKALELYRKREKSRER